MNANNTSNRTAPNERQLGYFNIIETQSVLVTEALMTARKLRKIGDGYIEDIVRAMILIIGSGLSRTLYEYPDAEDDEDFDLQEQAYYEGVSELQDRFPNVLRQLRAANDAGSNH